MWARSPFASHRDFVRSARELGGRWLAAGLLERAERETVIAAAEHARLSGPAGAGR
ncbi:hypothetical protein ACIGO6_09135 [Streptomyces sp. NPDC053750]|uniref:hypothetical protein n=1 Tax=Streptomyces sp. NPDC053750 TaxID=3365714 RepID=UPI0037D491B7